MAMINNNGFEYVDLGLPSGTLWATMNIGASKPSDAGQYFQWGDTIGYTEDQLGFCDGKKKFIWGDYKWSINASDSNFSKYKDRGTTLDLEDDAAHVNMGGDWHMPTPDQIRELLNNTTNTWTTQDGVNGRLFTSKKDGSKSIFIPAAGYAWDGSVQNSRDNGYVWSSMLHTFSASFGQDLYFNSGGAHLYGSYTRYGGLSVRGVIDKKNDTSKEEKNNMNDNLNLVEILKDAPKGTKLWSPVFGDCKFIKIKENNSNYPIVCTIKIKGLTDSKEYAYFSNKGELCIDYSNTECILFPSKENRDWSTFNVPKQHKHFEPYQKVLVNVYSEPSPNNKIWFPDIYLFYEEQNGCHRVAINKYVHNDGNIIPFEGNEDKVGKIVEK